MEEKKKIYQVIDEDGEYPEPQIVRHQTNPWIGTDDESEGEGYKIIPIDTPDGALSKRGKRFITVDPFLAELEAEEPPVVAAVVSIAPPSDSITGTVIGPYRIERLIGRGRMSEVYLAEDTRVSRPVAIKILPDEFSREQVQSIQQEFRAASALNHPNIATVCEVGELKGSPFIVSEYIEGTALHCLIPPKGMNLDQALEITIQVASALSAAHQTGIIHGDIKPENIMVRSDGAVKVLDFGLAKLAEAAHSFKAESLFSFDPLVISPGEEPGPVCYLSYASPEQVRGQKVDARTDIFSLGIVLYAMVIGRLPFTGSTTREVMTAIEEREALPVTKFNPDLPSEIQRIIWKALRKDLDERYRTIRDMLRDLQELKRDLAERSSREQGSSRSGGRADALRAKSRAARIKRRVRSKTSPFPNSTSNGQTSISTPAVENAKKGRAGLTVVIICLLALIAGSIMFYQKFAPAARREPPSFDQFSLERLSGTGNILMGTISPDGEQAAYVMGEGAKRGLWLKHLATGSITPVVAAAESHFWGLAFTRDSRLLYYVIEDPNNRVGGALYQVPTAGGEPRRLLTRIDGAVSFSPDGQQMVFKRYNVVPGTTALVVADADGANQRTIALAGTTMFLHYAWSPTDDKIAYVARREAENGYNWYLAEMPASGGQERSLSAPLKQVINSFGWMPDGEGLIVVSADTVSGAVQLWHLAYPNGAITPLTRDLNNYSQVSIADDGSKIAAIQTTRPASIWVAPVQDPGRARQITPNQSLYERLAWTPQGNIVHSLGADGRTDLWLMSADGRPLKQLTKDGGRNTMPEVTADGRHIVFVSNRSGATGIWRMDADGDNPTQLTSDGGVNPGPSPDGQWVVYEVQKGSQWTIRKVPMQGGAPVHLATGSNAAVSADGKWLAYEFNDPQTRQERIGIMPFNGGESVKVLDVKAGPGRIRWARDSRALAFIQQGGREIFVQPVFGGGGRSILKVEGDPLLAFDISRDGKQIAYTVGRVTSDLIVFSRPGGL